MYGHFAVYESLNRCTRARFCCRLEVGSLISAFRFPLCVSIVNFKNTTPSGDIPREHYRQHCQYRLRGLRYIARGLESSIRGNTRRHLVISLSTTLSIQGMGPKVYCAWPGIEHNKEEHTDFQQMAPHS